MAGKKYGMLNILELRVPYFAYKHSSPRPPTFRLHMHPSQSPPFTTIKSTNNLQYQSTSTTVLTLHRKRRLFYHRQVQHGAMLGLQCVLVQSLNLEKSKLPNKGSKPKYSPSPTFMCFLFASFSVVECTIVLLSRIGTILLSTIVRVRNFLAHFIIHCNFTLYKYADISAYHVIYVSICMYTCPPIICCSYIVELPVTIYLTIDHLCHCTLRRSIIGYCAYPR
jgi:hypothetical protein